MKKILILLMMAIVCGKASAEPFSLVGPKAKARIVLSREEPEHVVLAARDLASDVRAISGAELKVVRGRRARKGDVFVKTSRDDGRWEAYDVEVSRGVLEISGSDARGTMFGIYDFIERYLGVDPLSWWNDTPLPQKKELSWDDVSIHQGSPEVKFRGWFINDEDLLTDWKEPSGKRDIDYAYYRTVVNHGVMEKIAETLVRCRFNLIIPASFLNIHNPAEAGLADICAKRGVFISMHHVEPMGVSGFTYKNYWKERGEDAVFSYFSNPEKMEEVWRETARKWAKYPNVIWQVGLRGIADKPIWSADPNVPKSDEGRGKLISDAIARQVSILDEIGVPEKDRYVTTTLWMEGAALNRQGYLTFPENVIVVFADNGPGWKWTPDFRSVERNPANKYGVYYHHALIHDGPHLASLVPAVKTYGMMQDAVRMQSSEYAIFNVSNIREFTYNIDATSRMLWDMDSFSPEDWTEDWIARHISRDREKWKRAFNMYYNSLQLHPVAGIPMFLDGYMYKDVSRKELSRLAKEIRGKGDSKDLLEPFAPSAPSPEEERALRERTRKILPDGKAATYSSLCAQKASFELVKDLAASLYRDLPEQEKPFAYTTLVHPSALMYHLTAFTADIILAREQFSFGDADACEKSLEGALSELAAIKQADESYCSGKWENWYRGCRKVNLDELEKSCMSLLRALKVAREPKHAEYDVFLLIGQSNMAGRGEMLDEDRAPVSGVFLLDGEGACVPASAPLNRYSTIRKGMSMQGYGLGMSFGEEVHAKSGRPVLLVVNARGGSAIDSWAEGTHYFDEAVSRCRQAMEYGELKAILWHQGESDGKSQAMADAYPAKFTALVDALRKNLGNVPVIMGEVLYDYSGAEFINPVLNAVADSVPDCVIVSAEGCAGKADRLHFNRAGAKLLGERYAEAFQGFHLRKK